MIGKVCVRTFSTTYMRILIEKLEAGSKPDELLISKAHGELLEFEKERDTLVVSELVGHWAVPHTDGTLKELREAAAGNMSSDFVLRLIKGRGGKQLCDEQYHNCSFYSSVVVFK